FPATLQTGVDHWVITQGEVLVQGGVTTGSVSLAAGSYLVTAVPAAGYTFGDHQAAFNLTIATPEGGCAQIVQPVAPTATPATCTGPGLAGNGAINLGDAQDGVASWTITQNDEVVATKASGSVVLPAG